MPKESAAGERRVALVPEIVTKLVPSGFEVLVERGAGEAASFPDAAYEEAGARIADDAWSGADAVVKVQKPSGDEVARLHEGQRGRVELRMIGPPCREVPGRLEPPIELVEGHTDVLGDQLPPVVERIQRGESLGLALVHSELGPDVRRLLLGHFASEELADGLDRHYLYAAAGRDDPACSSARAGRTCSLPTGASTSITWARGAR